MPLSFPLGFTASNKVPGFKAEVRNGQGASSVGQRPRYLMISGYKGALSTLTDYEVTDVTDFSEAIAAALPGSELAGMLEVASKTPGLPLKMQACPEPSGGVAATITVVFAFSSGTVPTSVGTARFVFDEYELAISIGKSDTLTNMGDNVVAQGAGTPNMFCAGVNTAGSVVFTVKNKGARGNDHFLLVDRSKLPSNVTVTVTGGTPLSTGAVPFTGGTLTDTIATVLAATEAGRYDYTAWAQNEAANVDDICAQAAAKAAYDKGRPENVVVGFAGTSGNATTRSQLMNQVLAQLVWLEGRVHPSKLAVAVAAYRAVVEAQPTTFIGSNPNAVHDFAQIFGIPPHHKQEHSPNDATQQAMLNTGVTPIVSINGTPRILRSITSRSLNGSNPDYSCLDTATAVVPQRFREYIDNLWTNEHRVANPYVGPDPADGSLAPDGVSTPRLWNSMLYGEMLRAEDANLLTRVDEKPPTTEYNDPIDGLVSDIPCIVTPQNHQAVAVLRQIPA